MATTLLPKGPRTPKNAKITHTAGTWNAGCVFASK